VILARVLALTLELSRVPDQGAVDAIAEASRAAGVPRALALAVCTVESGLGTRGAILCGLCHRYRAVIVVDVRERDPQHSLAGAVVAVGVGRGGEERVALTLHPRHREERAQVCDQRGRVEVSGRRAPTRGAIEPRDGECPRRIGQRGLDCSLGGLATHCGG